MSLYSTDTLMKYHGDHEVEVREQVITLPFTTHIHTVQPVLCDL